MAQGLTTSGWQHIGEAQAGGECIRLHQAEPRARLGVLGLGVLGSKGHMASMTAQGSR